MLNQNSSQQVFFFYYSEFYMYLRVIDQEYFSSRTKQPSTPQWPLFNTEQNIILGNENTLNLKLTSRGHGYTKTRLKEYKNIYTQQFAAVSQHKNIAVHGNCNDYFILFQVLQILSLYIFPVVSAVDLQPMDTRHSICNVYINNYMSFPVLSNRHGSVVG